MTAMQALREIELALEMLCQERRMKLCLVLDEFDELYRTLPRLTLANLRALRDANKYSLCYVLVLRELPARLRAPAELESFYEPFSRCLLYLGPYSATDAEQMMRQLEVRAERTLSEAERAQWLRLSGGHPGFMVAMFGAFAEGPMPVGDDWEEWAWTMPDVQEECRKLWIGLEADDRLALSHLVNGITPAEDVRQGLEWKGLVQPKAEEWVPFSPLFYRFILKKGIPVDRNLWVDEAARQLWMGKSPVHGITALEFDLIAFLYSHAGKVCSKDEILPHLYSADYQDPAAGISDERLVALVKRLREKIESVRRRPRYLLTIRGKGYKLVAAPVDEQPPAVG